MVVCCVEISTLADVGGILVIVFTVDPRGSVDSTDHIALLIQVAVMASNDYLSRLSDEE